MSQSKISTFLQCPYRYYTTYTLKLREKKDASPTYSDDGTFLHYVFEHFLRSARQSDNTLALPSNEKIPGIVDEILKEYLAEVCPFPPELIDGRLLHLFSRLHRLALRMLENIICELSASRFVPAFFEKDIGAYGENGLPPFVIELKNNSRVFLTGKVDRIDLLEQNGRMFFRVIDYKSGKHEFSLKDVKSGNEIQLVLYLFAFLSSDPDKLVPAGAQYLFNANQNGHAEVCRSGFILNDEELLQSADTSQDRRFTADLIRQTAEEMKMLSDEMKNAVSGVAEQILSGEAEKTPSEKACSFCPVRNNCDKVFHK